MNDNEKRKTKQVTLFNEDGTAAMIFTRYHGGGTIVEQPATSMVINFSSKQRNEFIKFCDLKDPTA